MGALYGRQDVHKPSDMHPDIWDELQRSGMEKGDIAFCWDVATSTVQSMEMSMVLKLDMAATVRPEMASMFTAMTLKMAQAAVAYWQAHMLKMTPEPDPKMDTKAAHMAQWKTDLAKYGVKLGDGK